MDKTYNGSSPRKYDEDVSKRFGFQTQIQSSNPSYNPNYSTTPLEQNRARPLSAPQAPPTLVPPRQPVSGTYIGPHLYPTNQLPRRNKCADCSVCCIMFGVFLIIKGIIMLSIASKFDVDWTSPPRRSALHILGPIALSIGIALSLLACICITSAKCCASVSNSSHAAVNYPVISGGSHDRSDSTFVEVSDHHSAHHGIHGSSSHMYDSPPSYDTTWATTTTTSDPSPSSSSTCDASPSSTTDY